MKKYLYKIRLFIALTLLTISLIGIGGLFYQIKIFDIQFLPLFERLIQDFSIVTLVLFLSMILITFIFGRIYCSTICPFGILQEICSLVLKRKKNKKPIKNYILKYFICSISFGLLIGGSSYLFKFLDPYTNFSGLSTFSISAIIVSTLVLIIVFYKDRFFCTNICPIGTVLGLIAKVSIFKIGISGDCVKCKKCEKICPSNCINIDSKTVNNETCIKCLKCLDVCPKDGIEYTKFKTLTKFSHKRREFILASINLALLGAAIKVGNVVFTIPTKIKNVILPPGAVSEKHVLNSCLNCNLCVQYCPNKIIKKANDNFKAVHIDYANNSCKYDCNKCSEVCPSGAIKKLTLSEKQKTRIGIAVLKQENCNKCLKCKDICPCSAIIIDDNKLVIDSSKCIGCGLCKVTCDENAIEVYSVNEQRMI